MLPNGGFEVSSNVQRRYSVRGDSREKSLKATENVPCVPGFSPGFDCGRDTRFVAPPSQYAKGLPGLPADSRKRKRWLVREEEECAGGRRSRVFRLFEAICPCDVQASPVQMPPLQRSLH